MKTTGNQTKNIIFDLGGVLIDWNPRYLYRKLLPEDQVEWFLREVCDSEWNEQQDAGRSFKDAIEIKAKEFPNHRSLIEAYFQRWQEMLGDAIHGTVEIFDTLDRQGWPLYALSNWSAETFHHAEGRFEFLGRFKGRVVSGFEGVKKPDRKIFELLSNRFKINPQESLFIDDVEKNVRAASEYGFQTIQFQDPKALLRELKGRGIIS